MLLAKIDKTPDATLEEISQQKVSSSRRKKNKRGVRQARRKHNPKPKSKTKIVSHIIQIIPP